MAIKASRTQGALHLDIDNGDVEKLDQCMAKWGFKDEQSFLRFAISIMLVTEDKSLWIKITGQPQPISPAKEFLKD